MRALAVLDRTQNSSSLHLQLFKRQLSLSWIMKGNTMNCPKHIKETTGPDALKKIKEREELEELTEFLAGPEEDYVS